MKTQNKPNPYTNIRISPRAHKALAALAKKDKRSIIATLDVLLGV